MLESTGTELLPFDIEFPRVRNGVGFGGNSGLVEDPLSTGHGWFTAAGHGLTVFCTPVLQVEFALPGDSGNV